VTDGKEFYYHATKPIRRKTLMDKKKMIFQATQPVNNLTMQDLPIELAELSEEVLSEVRGGEINLFRENKIPVLKPINPLLCCCSFCDINIPQF
jgi:hypothetical protein